MPLKLFKDLKGAAKLKRLKNTALDIYWGYIWELKSTTSYPPPPQNIPNLTNFETNPVAAWRGE
jgi:hypothetical protein